MKTAAPLPSPERTSLQPSKRQAGMTFAILLTINILNYMDRTILPAVLPHLGKEFGLSNTEEGLLGSSFLLIYGLATLPLGMWADKGIRKNIVGVCVGVWSIATSLAGLTHNFIQLLLTRSVLGIGEAGYAPASLSMIGDFFPKEQRGRILSYWSVSNVVGTALGLVIGGIVADTLGWRWAFYLVGIPGLIAAFLIWRAHEPRRGAFDTEGDNGQDLHAGHGSLGRDVWGTAQKLFKIRTYWVLAAAFIFSFFIVGAAQFWIPKFIGLQFGLTSAQAGSISGGVLAGGSIVGTILGGWLADFLQRRMPQGRMLISTISFLLGAPLTLLALSLSNLVAFICVFVLAILCLSMCLGPLNAVIQDIIVPEMRATGIGLVLLLAHVLGDAASPLLIGIIADRYHSLALALLTTAPTCLFLAGIICLFGLKTVAPDMRAMQAQLNKARG